MRLHRAGFVAVLVTVVLAVALSTWKSVEACGPDFEPDIFVNAQRPDDPAAFAAGHLGLIGNKFDSNEYAIAYRYLNGGTVAAGDQKALAPASEETQDWSNLTPAQAQAAQAAEQQRIRDASAPGQWLRARAQYAGAMAADEQKAEFPQQYDGSIVFDDGYLNCPDPAFHAAAQTLEARAAAWGAQSAWLKDWIAGQDAVFANCAKNPSPPLWTPPNAPKPTVQPPSVPQAAPANAPELLRQDRAYQMAAAAFYGKQFDQAAQDFAAIAQDRKSPWSGWGGYLEARATVRKAFAMGSETNPYDGGLATFDRPTMQKAQQMLEGQLAEKHPRPSREVIQGELNMVLMRLDPQKRLEALCAAIEGPGADANFTNDVGDLNFFLVKQINIDKKPPLLQWIEGWRGSTPQLTAVWEQTHGLPWLVAAIANVEPTDAKAPELLAAAANVKPGAPGYETVFYHRVRLLTATKENDQARAMLDAALPQAIHEGPSSYMNALLSERMAVARNFDEFLEFAPRIDLVPGGLNEDKATPACDKHAPWFQELGHCLTQSRPAAFDEDTAATLNRRLPLAMLIEAAQSERIPPNLRRDLALAAWTRAVVLEDAPSAAKLAPLLPADLRNAVGTDVGFKADVAVLHNPGLRPYVEAGSTRLDKIGELDPYHDNWWDSHWVSVANNTGDSSQDAAPAPPAFLTSAQVAEAKAQVDRVRVPDGVTVIGGRVIAYAKAHRDDPAVPEALALTVRATHYGAGEPGDQPAAERKAISKEAFELLHSRYPDSAWTKKTKYYY